MTRAGTNDGLDDATSKGCKTTSISSRRTLSTVSLYGRESPAAIRSRQRTRQQARLGAQRRIRQRTFRGQERRDRQIRSGRARRNQASEVRGNIMHKTLSKGTATLILG